MSGVGAPRTPSSRGHRAAFSAGELRLDKQQSADELRLDKQHWETPRGEPGGFVSLIRVEACSSPSPTEGGESSHAECYTSRGRYAAGMQAASLFERAYGRSPDRVVWAPGRVNLIGEHLDYTLLPVLPVAIQFGVGVAATPTDTGRIRAVSAGYPDVLDIDVDATDQPPGWHRYVWAACRESGVTAGADIAVAGDLFADGGLSSSSALTLATIVALSSVDGDELVLDASRAERSVGIEGGLMDQTVIVHGQHGHALHISFGPLRHRPVIIPDGVRLVAAHSGGSAPKSDLIRDAFDARVAGGRIAAAMIGDLLGVDPGRPPLLGRVAALAGIDEVVAALPETLAPSDAPAEEADLVRFTARSLDPSQPVPVRVVASHVVTESRRVAEIGAALAVGDLTAVGASLDASHASLGRYGATTAALDVVCSAMRRAGAAGARMTGAGWGGFAVAVCRPDRVAEVIDAAVAATGGPAFEVIPSRGLSR